MDHVNEMRAIRSGETSSPEETADDGRMKGSRVVPKANFQSADKFLGAPVDNAPQDTGDPAGAVKLNKGSPAPEPSRGV